MPLLNVNLMGKGEDIENVATVDMLMKDVIKVAPSIVASSELNSTSELYQKGISTILSNALTKTD